MSEQNSPQSTSQATAATSGGLLRTALIGVIVVLVFVASYQVAGAVGRGAGSGSAGVPGSSDGLVPVRSGDSSSAGSAGCANPGTGETVEGTAVVEDGVQRINVDATNGYDPNVIKLAAGIPTEITFSQASGCMAQVMSRELGFFEDLTAGPKTISLPALEPGTYGFACGMEMVFGEIIVE